MIKVNKPLELEGAVNIRELGGYKTADGRVTKSNVYLRGDRTDSLTDDDIKKLKEYGVTLEIDLRSPQEVDTYPSKLADHDEIEYKNVVMFDSAALFASRETMPKSLAELYIGFLDNAQSQYADIFRSLLENEGVSFFHCTAGKDRTGVLAMLILDLAGVPDGRIITDYEISEKNLEILFKTQKIDLGKIKAENMPSFLFSSAPHEMEKTLEYFRKTYKNAREYLKLCGLSDDELDRLNDKFIS